MNQWWKESVIYQIYPRSFSDSNGDGIGDLPGIIRRLDYLKELGIDIIWLSPVYQSPNDDNGYDISDYQKIMPDFGTMDDFERMLIEAHDRGIKVIMDLVVNHTSDEHRWFQESRKSKDNPYRDYYIWKEGKEGGAPNNWGGSFGGSAWEKDDRTGMYYLHTFSRKQPDLNWENPKLRKEIYDMMIWWCDRGIDGFRMDVISMISKQQDFPDGETKDGLYGDFTPYVMNGPRVHEYLKEMNREVLSKYDIMTVGETSGVTVREAAKYAGEHEKELNMIFHFEHVELGHRVTGKWSDTSVPLRELKPVFNKWQMELEGIAWNSLYWDNHDQPRAVSRFGNDSPMYRELSAKMLATCLHMMKGTPYIYQGEELAMTNAYFDRMEDYRDIESLNAYQECTAHGIVSGEQMMRCLKMVGRDNARTPMQWDASKHAGFTEGEPWIQTNKNYLQINAAEQVGKETSVFTYYKELITLRRKYKIIVYGAFIPLLEEDEKIYAYERVLGNEKLVIACNFSEHEAECPVFDEYSGGTELISNYKEHKKGCLQPYEAVVRRYEK